MSPRNIIEEFIDDKTLLVLKHFLFNEEGPFYLSEIAKKTRVPVATTYRIINRLKELGVVEETRIKKSRLYSLSHNKNTDKLAALLEEKKTVLEEFVEHVSRLDGVEMIVKHGEDARDKANLIIIGRNVDSKAVKAKVGDIKEKYDFNIIEYVLDPSVFNQMSQGGLISGKKVILWESSSEETK